MARNEHKKVLQQLSEAYQNVQERYKMRDPDGDGSWPDDERQEEREKDPNYGEPEYQDTDGEYGEDNEEAKALERELGGGRFDHPGKTYRSGSPRVRLTRDSPGTSSVHLPVDDPRIQKYLDKGYKIVKDYKKAEQSEDAEDKDLHPATRAGEDIIGSDVIWDNHQMKGIVKKVDVELGMAIAIDDKGEPHIIELGAVDAILDPNTETPEEFKHLY